jgi:hypothetical protein
MSLNIEQPFWKADWNLLARRLSFHFNATSLSYIRAGHCNTGANPYEKPGEAEVVLD